MAEPVAGARNLEIACTLGAADMSTRADEWRRLRETWGIGADATDSGACLRLRPGARGEAERLARMEAECCSFLDIELSVTGEVITLEISSPAADARPVILALAGLGG